MRTRSLPELATWAALTVAGGTTVALFDRTTSEVQGTLLLLMLLDFGLTLPGRAPVVLVAVASVVPMYVSFVVSAHSWNPAMLFLLVPALIAAGGGQLAGRLLDIAAARLEPSERRIDLPWYRRPLDRRVLLGVALAALAAVGVPLIQGVLASGQARAPLWIAMVWQIITLLGWIGLTPLILEQRSAMGVAGSPALSPSVSDVGVHAAAVGALAVVHAITVASIGRLLLIPKIPLYPEWHDLVYAAFTMYLPLDLLAYLTIVSLGHASDVAANRRQAVMREAALRGEMVASRLVALRARLNPHFLFNALSGVRVLAAGGKFEQAGAMISGLTDLLRYVLDERRATVPLDEELEFVRAYLTVQQARFGDRLRFAIDRDPSLAHVAIPQLLLQPLVENAVEHGVEKTLDGGWVRIRARQVTDRVRLVIENDGPPADRSAPEGIGLTSTRERLERLYGSSAALRLEPLDHGRGTRIVIEVPLSETASTS
jgi:hypothetical protein